MAFADTGDSATGAQRSASGRRVGRILVLLVLPFLVLGVILTLSLYGIYLGLPLLLVTWPPFRAGRRVMKHPDDSAALKRLARGAAFAGTVLAAVVVGTVAVGWDDLDSLDEIGGLVVGLAWTGGFWWVAFAAHRLVHRP